QGPLIARQAVTVLRTDLRYFYVHEPATDCGFSGNERQVVGREVDGIQLSQQLQDSAALHSVYSDDFLVGREDADVELYISIPLTRKTYVDQAELCALTYQFRFTVAAMAFGCCEDVYRFEEIALALSVLADKDIQPVYWRQLELGIVPKI